MSKTIMSKKTTAKITQSYQTHLVVIGTAHSKVLAALHSDSFDKPWSEDSFINLLQHPGTYGWLACREDPVGFILCRSIAGEGEVLTIAVLKTFRKAGIASTLLAEALETEVQNGSAIMHLEVAIDNVAAKALYNKAGFISSGKRTSYYARKGQAFDAIVMSKDLKEI